MSNVRCTNTHIHLDQVFSYYLSSLARLGVDVVDIAEHIRILVHTLAIDDMVLLRILGQFEEVVHVQAA